MGCPEYSTCQYIPKWLAPCCCSYTVMVTGASFDLAQILFTVPCVEAAWGKAATAGDTPVLELRSSCTLKSTEVFNSSSSSHPSIGIVASVNVHIRACIHSSFLDLLGPCEAVEASQQTSLSWAHNSSRTSFIIHSWNPFERWILKSVVIPRSRKDLLNRWQSTLRLTPELQLSEKSKGSRLESVSRQRSTVKTPGKMTSDGEAKGSHKSSHVLLHSSSVAYDVTLSIWLHIFVE
ncbi:hypothetical protein UY3_17906 [Chelonia mydas]|uniref:Uncharacterized protein n=1 Tax=Chelonia mydas TaxID=8469 RepID=M7AQC2_CHEMY|nr:hypothetical protein UY3_17906 [Chelonia mydas]